MFSSLRKFAITIAPILAVFALLGLPLLLRQEVYSLIRLKPTSLPQAGSRAA